MIFISETHIKTELINIPFNWYKLFCDHSPLIFKSVPVGYSLTIMVKKKILMAMPNNKVEPYKPDSVRTCMICLYFLPICHSVYFTFQREKLVEVSTLSTCLF